MKGMASKVFILIAILVIGFAIYDYKKSQTEESDKIIANRLFPNRGLDDVESFKIHSLFGEIIVESKDGQWRTVSPVADQADKQASELYLTQLLNQEIKRVDIETGNAVDWPQYGLDKPDGWVEVTFKDKTKTLVQVGTVRGIEDSHFLRENLNDRLLIGNRDWTTLVNQPPQEFRNKSLFDVEGEVTQFSIHEKDVLTFKKIETLWKADAQEKVESDQSKVSDFVTILGNFKASLVVADTKDDLKTFGLNKPFLEVRVESAKEKRQISFGNGAKGKVYAASSAREGIFEVPTDRVTTLKRTLKDFDPAPKPDLNKAQETH